MLVIPTKQQSTPNTAIMMPKTRSRRGEDELVQFVESTKLGDKREIFDATLLSTKNLGLSESLETKLMESHMLDSGG